MSPEVVRQAFLEALDLPPGVDVETLEIGKHPQWDSVGHMTLVAELESRFNISLDTDDLIAMESFAETLAILRRYGVEV